MMPLSLMMSASPNNFGKHCIIASETSNIILSVAKNIISPLGDASLYITEAEDNPLLQDCVEIKKILIASLNTAKETE